MALIDNRIYVAGRRTAVPTNLDETYELLRECGGMAWIGLYRPDAAEIHSVAAEFSLHSLAVEDALKGHQRAKLERYGTRCLSYCGRPGTSIRRRRSSSAKCTCSSDRGLS